MLLGYFVTVLLEYINFYKSGHDWPAAWWLPTALLLHLIDIDIIECTFKSLNNLFRDILLVQ